VPCIVVASELIGLRVFKEVHQPKDSNVVVDAKSAPKLFLGKRALPTREPPLEPHQPVSDDISAHFSVCCRSCTGGTRGCVNIFVSALWLSLFRKIYANYQRTLRGDAFIMVGSVSVDVVGLDTEHLLKTHGALWL
jgi:hypothetical protein